MELGKETFIKCAEFFLLLVTMETNPLRGLFGASLPRPVEQRVAPRPTEPTGNVYFEIPSGMIEKLLANPFTSG